MCYMRCAGLPGPWNDICLMSDHQCCEPTTLGRTSPQHLLALPCPCDPSAPHTSRRILWRSLKGGKGKTYMRLRVDEQQRAHARGSTRQPGDTTRAEGCESCPRTDSRGKASCLTTVPSAGKEQVRCGHASRTGDRRGGTAGQWEGSRGGRAQDRPLQCTLL